MNRQCYSRENDTKAWQIMSHTTDADKKNNLTIILTVILLVSSLGQVMSDLYLPSLPAIARDLKVDTHYIQLTVALYMLGFCVSQLIYGPLSDAIGRRKPLLFGMALCVLASVLCTFSINIYMLYLGRLLQGLGIGAGTALARALLRDLFEHETLAKYNSYLAMSTVIILTIAPILGGYIEYYAGWRFNFSFLSLYGMLVLYLFYFNIRETNQYLHPENFTLPVIARNVKTLLTSTTFLRFAFCPLLTYGGILAWLTAAPIVLQERVGLNPVEFGWLYVVSGLGFASGGFINANFVEKFGINKMMCLGFLLQLGAGLFMLGFYLLGYINTVVIILPIMVYMMGSSLVFPNSSAGAFGPFAKIAGSAGAVFGFMQVLGGVVSSSVISMMHDDNQLPMAMAFIVSASMAAVIFLLLPKGWGKE